MRQLLNKTVHKPQHTEHPDLTLVHLLKFFLNAEGDKFHVGLTAGGFFLLNLNTKQISNSSPFPQRILELRCLAQNSPAPNSNLHICDMRDPLQCPHPVLQTIL